MEDQSIARSVAEVEAIIALNDQPILRNLKITQCYHDISQAIATLIGRENMNWCTFATWASKTAGSFIRTEQITEEMRKALGDASGYKKWWIASINKKLQSFQTEKSVTHSSLLGYIEAVIAEMSSDVAAGNLKVFSELGPLFVDMVNTLGGDTSYDAMKLEYFLERARIAGQGSDQLLRSDV